MIYTLILHIVVARHRLHFLPSVCKQDADLLYPIQFPYLYPYKYTLPELAYA